MFTLAELARRRRARGRGLSAPEAIALICDEMLEAAWDGASMDEVVAIGRQVLREEDVMGGVRALVDRVEVDCLFPSGTCLVVVEDPILPRSLPDRAPEAATPVPGAVLAREGSLELNAGRRAVELPVVNDGDRSVFVSSHYPFAEANGALRFDRDRAAGMRLDIPAGASLMLAPGVHRTVRLVEFGGARRVPRFQVRGLDPSSPRGDDHDG